MRQTIDCSISCSSSSVATSVSVMPRDVFPLGKLRDTVAGACPGIHGWFLHLYDAACGKTQELSPLVMIPPHSDALERAAGAFKRALRALFPSGLCNEVFSVT